MIRDSHGLLFATIGERLVHQRRRVDDATVAFLLAFIVRRVA